MLKKLCKHGFQQKQRRKYRNESMFFMLNLEKQRFYQFSCLAPPKLKNKFAGILSHIRTMVFQENDHCRSEFKHSTGPMRLKMRSSKICSSPTPPLQNLFVMLVMLSSSPPSMNPMNKSEEKHLGP